MSEDSQNETRTELQIDDVLAGRSGPAADPTVLWVAAASRPAPPPGLLARIDSQVAAAGGAEPSAAPSADAAPVRRRRTDRPGLFLTGVAAILAFAFVFQGVGNLVAGRWISEGLGEPYAPHAFREGGLAMIAIGVCAAAAAASRRWSSASVLASAPLAIGFGLHGFTEIGVFGAGVALHLTQGALGVLLVLAWWLDRREKERDTSAGSHEARA